jgi:ribokinase
MRKKIVVIGSTNVDFILKTDRLPRMGETVVGSEFLQTYGGKGANCAVGTARAGGDVFFVGCVGDDPYIPPMLEQFRKDGIHMDHLFRETGVTTGIALCMVDASGNNYLTILPGSNGRITPALIDRTRGVMGDAEVVVLQCEFPIESVIRAVDLAAELGRKILFNLAPAKPVGPATLQKVDTLVVNEVEAEFLCGFPVADDNAYSRAVQAMLAMGPSVAIITLGAKGSFVATAAREEMVPAFPVRAVDSTAAGDIYCGSLAVALAEGKPLRAAVRFASAAAALSVMRLGAQPSAPRREEIDTFLAQQGTGGA